MRQVVIAPDGASGEPNSRADVRARADAGAVRRAGPPAGGSGRHRRLLGAAAFWCAGGFALWLGARIVCPDGSCRALDLDRRILGLLDALRQPWLDAVMSAASWLGSIVVLLPLALALAWRRWSRGPRADALLPLVAVGGAWLLAHVGKLLVARPRPDLHPALVALPADLSFPSAHAMQITAFAVAWALPRDFRPGWAHAAAATAAILAVALSRLYLQVHFPSDVAAGTIAAAAWAVGLRLLAGARP